MFRIGNLVPTVKPTITYDMMEFGEHYRGQAGTSYTNINAKKLTMSIEFPRLNRVEKETLEYYCMARSSNAFFQLELIDRDRAFDGLTVDPNLGRVLGKVKIVSWRFSPFKYDDAVSDNASLEKATLTVEEV